jgi:nucleoside 2-deoxyribosyltransferase
MHKKRILIVGEVFVDQHLDIVQNGCSVSRLGGIFHAARCCHALDMEYALAYYAPSYLKKDIEYFARSVLHAVNVYCLGIVDKSPNVMLIGQSDECGNQQYNNILCQQAEYINQTNLYDILKDFNPSDVVLFPGRYGNIEALEQLSAFNGSIHIDMSYDCEDFMKQKWSVHFTTIFLSTSSTTFGSFFAAEDYSGIIQFFSSRNVNQLIVKENRGGSWLYDYSCKEDFEAPAYPASIIHSVGVGDVYDIAYLSDVIDGDYIQKMALAAWIAMVYAKTLDHSKFCEDARSITQNCLDFVGLDGVRVPWNERRNYPIYIAAPDFDYVDVKIIDDLESDLNYHNFVAHRPVRENGQVNEAMHYSEKMAVFSKDMELLSNCSIMIAVLLYNDQGTLVEIGNYQAAGKPIILYDPYKIANNMFLRNACTEYCNTRSEVIDAVFGEMNRMVKE